MLQPKDLTEKTLSREDKYQGRILSVHVDEVLLPNGNTSTREVVDHVDGVAVLALDDRNNVLTVTQYRYVFGKTLLELPAGKLEPGEDPAECGIRELREETGCTAGKFVFLGKLIPTCAYDSEVIHLYLAEDLSYGEQDLDENEFLSVEKYTLDEALEMIYDGTIIDGKTQVALLKFKLLRDAGRI